jgi:cellulose 1,4-beta-cellobiosidase
LISCPFSLGDKTFFGAGSTFRVNTQQPFTVRTQFITSDGTDAGDLVEIRRTYRQNGVTIQNSQPVVGSVGSFNSISDKYCAAEAMTFNSVDGEAARGGLKAMGQAMDRGMVLVLSLWDDYKTNMLWLDSIFPVGASPSTPGALRGSCATDSGVPSQVENQYPNAVAKYSNIKFGEIGTTF